MATVSKLAILDTGALVAFLSKPDRHHLWAVAAFKKLPPALVTCEAVLSELFFLLRRDSRAISAVIDIMRRQLVRVVAVSEDLQRVLELMEKYRDIPMSFADAGLVFLAESHPESCVVTTDSDFNTYRIRRNKKINLVLAR